MDSIVFLFDIVDFLFIGIAPEPASRIIYQILLALYPFGYGIILKQCPDISAILDLREIAD